MIAEKIETIWLVEVDYCSLLNIRRVSCYFLKGIHISKFEKWRFYSHVSNTLGFRITRQIYRSCLPSRWRRIGRLSKCWELCPPWIDYTRTFMSIVPFFLYFKIRLVFFFFFNSLKVESMFFHLLIFHLIIFFAHRILPVY